MLLTTAIFDMDGLLIDSEPLWQEAGLEEMSRFGIQLTDVQYHASTGLRTPEWVDHWFHYFQIDLSHAPSTIRNIEDNALLKIKARGKALEGVEPILQFFRSKGFKIGLASSSPMRLIREVVSMLGIEKYLDQLTSAEGLPYGKPHPQVFIECAQQLHSKPNQCVVFEDSFNGMIAAKAAKMKCVVIPAPQVHEWMRWHAADAKLNSLLQFNEDILNEL